MFFPSFSSLFSLVPGFPLLMSCHCPLPLPVCPLSSRPALLIALCVPRIDPAKLRKSPSADSSVGKSGRLIVKSCLHWAALLVVLHCVLSRRRSISTAPPEVNTVSVKRRTGELLLLLFEADSNMFSSVPFLRTFLCGLTMQHVLAAPQILTPPHPLHAHIEEGKSACETTDAGVLQWTMRWWNGNRL